LNPCYSTNTYYSSPFQQLFKFIMPTILIQNCGQTGLAAAKALLAKGGITVRTTTRDTAKLTKKLAGLAVEVFASGDTAAFAGVDAFICIPPGGTPDPDDRVAIAIDFLQKAKDAGITHGALVSVVVAAAENRRGLFGAQFGAVEDAAAALDGVTVVSVRSPMFYENMWGDLEAIKSHDTFYIPIDGEIKQLTAAVSDVGAALAAAVLDSSLGTSAVHILGDNLTKNEIAALYSAKLGRTINFVHAPVEAAVEAFAAYGMPKWQVDGVIELIAFNETDTFVAAHKGEFEALVGSAPTTVKQYIDTALIHGLGK
tara:strand:- start:826 stop:1764 length:939 start_codon:yes stop_codon:yes gene_type:complete